MEEQEGETEKSLHVRTSTSRARIKYVDTTVFVGGGEIGDHLRQQYQKVRHQLLDFRRFLFLHPNLKPIETAEGALLLSLPEAAPKQISSSRMRQRRRNRPSGRANQPCGRRSNAVDSGPSAVYIRGNFLFKKCSD